MQGELAAVPQEHRMRTAPVPDEYAVMPSGWLAVRARRGARGIELHWPKRLHDMHVIATAARLPDDDGEAFSRVQDNIVCAVAVEIGGKTGETAPELGVG
jgi:hypothetical protein